MIGPFDPYVPADGEYYSRREAAALAGLLRAQMEDLLDDWAACFEAPIECRFARTARYCATGLIPPGEVFFGFRFPDGTQAGLRVPLELAHMGFGLVAARLGWAIRKGTSEPDGEGSRWLGE